MRYKILLPTLTTVVVLIACSSTPPAKLPAMDVPAAFKEAPTFIPIDPQAAEVPDAWWTLFNDPVLNDLVDRLSQGNQTLASAAAAVKVAQAASSSSRASLFPTVGVGAGASRSASAGNISPSTAYSVQGVLSNWELDLWGRVGATVDAAHAKLQASRHTLAATRLSLQASLVQTYFLLRSAEALAQLLDQTTAAYARSLELTQNRYQGGVATAADVAQAQTQLKSAQAQRLEAQLQRALSEHAIATLLGLAPAAVSVPAAQPGQTFTLPTVPTQLPATLLARRPDIAAAAAQVSAANAQIGAAQAAFFPAITLSANAGFRSGDWAQLIRSAHQFWSIGPSLALALLDGGSRRAASESAHASHDQTIATYRQAVLIALQEVEDNLASARVLEEEMALHQDSLTSARRALDIAQNQYKAGTVSYLSVTAAQTTVLATERSLLDVRNRRLAALNQLLKNLAGRWDQ